MAFRSDHPSQPIAILQLTQVIKSREISQQNRNFQVLFKNDQRIQQQFAAGCLVPPI